MTPIVETIVANIENGNADGGLGLIHQAMRDRARVTGEVFETIPKIQSSDFTVPFAPNQRVRFNDTVYPKYLIGTTATVLGFANTRVKVRLDRDVRRFKASDPLFCPPSTLSPI